MENDATKEVNMSVAERLSSVAVTTVTTRLFTDFVDDVYNHIKGTTKRKLAGRRVDKKVGEISDRIYNVRMPKCLVAS